MSFDGIDRALLKILYSAEGRSVEPFVDSVICESFGIQRMMGASLRKRGYSGWSTKPNTED